MADKTTGRAAPCISVIIPTYNRRELLLRAVNSALGQTEQDLEVIIADDGSTDGTGEMVRGMRDPRIRYLALPHGGACAARNAGLEAARGKYVAFLDSDDVWRAEKLRVQREQLEASGADVVFCAFVRHSLESRAEERCPAADVPEGRIESRRLLQGNLVSTQTLFGKAACMKATRFDERFPRMQDWEYALQLAQRYRLHYFSDVLVDVYLQKDSISSHPELALEAVRLLYAKYREEYRASAEDTVAMMKAFHHYALQCRRCCAREYGAMIMAVQGVESRLQLGKTAARFAVKELLTLAGGNRKVHA
ncbi:MAG: glycosyltransferase family 2 protein [Aristaeellaceae bacterium]